MTALAKVGLLFVSGLGIGLLVPLSRDRPTRFIPRPEETESARAPTVTVRLIVEQQSGGQSTEGSSDSASAPVEVILRPALRRQPPMPEEVVVKLRLGHDPAIPARPGNRRMPPSD
jgi:hypothetical protein